MLFLPVFVGILGMYIIVGVATFFGSVIAWSLSRFGFMRTLVGLLVVTALVLVALGLAALAAAPPAEKLELAKSLWATAASTVIGRDKGGFPTTRFAAIAVMVFTGFPVVTRLYARARGLPLPRLAKALYASVLFAAFTAFCTLVPFALARGHSGTRLFIPAAIMAVLAFLISRFVYSRELAKQLSWPIPHARSLGWRLGVVFALAITLMAFILREWVAIGMAGAMTIFLFLEAVMPGAWSRKTWTRSSAQVD